MRQEQLRVLCGVAAGMLIGCLLGGCRTGARATAPPSRAAAAKADPAAPRTTEAKAAAKADAVAADADDPGTAEDDQNAPKGKALLLVSVAFVLGLISGAEHARWLRRRAAKTAELTAQASPQVIAYCQELCDARAHPGRWYQGEVAHRTALQLWQELSQEERRAASWLVRERDWHRRDDCPLCARSRRRRTQPARQGPGAPTAPTSRTPPRSRAAR